jgi:hypothetical protein
MKLRQIAWVLILVVDILDVAWGAGAAISPETLLGPGGKAILPAGEEFFEGHPIAVRLAVGDRIDQGVGSPEQKSRNQ